MLKITSNSVLKAMVFQKHLINHCLPIIVTTRAMRTWEVDTLKLMKSRAEEFDAIPHPKRHKREWISWNFKSELYAFIKRLGEDIPVEKLRTAFIDESLVNVDIANREKWGVGDLTSNISVPHNEELSKKGHEILKEFAHKYLRYFLPRAPEECIQSVVEFLLSNESLFSMGEHLGFKDLVMSCHVDPPASIVAKSVKALMPLLIEEKGNHHCDNFIIDFVMPFLADKDLLEIWNPKEPQSLVDKILRINGFPQYEPRLLRETGRNTVLACFVVGLYSDKKLIGFSPGETIEIAHEMAAYDALRRFFGLTPGNVMLKFGASSHKLDYDSKCNKNPSLNEWSINPFGENSVKKIASSAQ